MGKLNIRPISFNAAKRWVEEYHRHSHSPHGWKFGAAIYEDERMVGVVMAKPPTARMADDGYTLEISRLCTDGTANACSFGYAAMVRAAKALGYCRVITYTLPTESGSSLRAIGFQIVGVVRPENWVRRRGAESRYITETIERIRWELQWSPLPATSLTASLF